MQNICGCGATAGYPHRPTCPYPLYQGTEADWAEWDAARAHLAEIYQPVWIGKGLGYAVLRMADLGDDDSLDRWIEEERFGTTYATAHEAREEAERLNREELDRIFTLDEPQTIRPMITLDEPRSISLRIEPDEPQTIRPRIELDDPRVA